MNRVDGERMSASRCYLGPDVRARDSMSTSTETSASMRAPTSDATSSATTAPSGDSAATVPRTLAIIAAYTGS